MLLRILQVIGLLMIAWGVSFFVSYGRYDALHLALVGVFLLFTPVLQRLDASPRGFLFGEIRDALCSAALELFAALERERPGETIYAFVFEVNPQLDHVAASVATEEGLDRLVRSYVAQGYRSSDPDSPGCVRAGACAGDRVEPTDSARNEGWFAKNDASLFAPAQRLIERAQLHRYLWPRDGTLFRLCLETLQMMDDRGAFSRGAERNQIVLGLFYNDRPTDEEHFLNWAAQLNAPAVMERLQQELEEGRLAARQLVIPIAGEPLAPGTDASFFSPHLDEEHGADDVTR